MAATASDVFLGRGIYDELEIAHLAGRSPYEIATWARPTSRGDHLLLPQAGRLFLFYDLVTALAVSSLLNRKVSLRTIRDARRWSARELGTPWPFAHVTWPDTFATSGADVYVRLRGQWADAGRGGQLPLEELTEQFVLPLEYEADGLARRWHPAPGVVLDPAVQAGAACIEGTRFSTAFLSDLVRGGEEAADIAFDYGLDVEAVERALSYEFELAA